jgi:hypothetical protein
MDDEAKELLRSLLAAQKEETELLKKHLLRIRFSLWSLLVLTSLVGTILGVMVAVYRPAAATVPPTATPTGTRLLLVPQTTPPDTWELKDANPICTE